MASADRPSFARALLLGCRAGLLAFLVLYTLCAVSNMLDRGVGHGDHLWGGAALRVPFVQRVRGRR